MDTLNLVHSLTLAQADAPPAAATPAPTPAPAPAPANGNATPAAPQTAQPGQPLTPNPSATKQQDPLGGLFMPVILIAVLAFMIIFSMRSQSKEKKKREQLLEAVKKGDKVQTIGGVRGTVTDIRDDEITLKVDENANVKIRYARSAIQSVISTKDED